VIRGESYGMAGTFQQQPPEISIRSNLWVLMPVVALIVAILSANLLLLNYVHVFTAILWTGTDIFMVFLLGPVLRNVNFSTRKEVISWIMPKMVFYANGCCRHYNCWLFSCFRTRFDYSQSTNRLLDLRSLGDSFCDVYTWTGDTITDKSSHLF
jgi:hypothetical protein